VLQDLLEQVKLEDLVGTITTVERRRYRLHRVRV
jgi:hypothetical protein